MADPVKPVNPFAPKGGAAKAPKKAASPFAPKPATKAADPVGAALNIGQSILNGLSTAGYFVEGYLNKAINQTQDVSSGKQAYNPVEIIANDIAAGNENATSWMRGVKTQTGVDLLKSAGMDTKNVGNVDVPLLGKINLPGLAVDIATDPTNLIPGKALTTPLKVAAVAGKTAIKAGKLAKIGQISEKIATDVAEGAVPKQLKPGAFPLEQYTKKPILPENLKTGAMAAPAKALETKVGQKYTYKTIESAVAPTTGEVVGSALEAGRKAAAATWLTELAKTDLTKLAKASRKASVVAAPKIVETGVTKDIVPFEPHVTPEGTFVFDGKTLHSFANEAEASAWTKAQAEAPKTFNVTRGGKPVVDSGLLSAATKDIPDVAVKNFDLQTAQNTLKAIDKITKNVVGVGAESVVKTAPKLKDFVKNALTTTEDPFATLRSFAGRGKNTQEASVAKKLGEMKVTGSTGKQATIAEIFNSGTPFAKLAPATQKQITEHFANLANGETKAVGPAVTKKYANFNELVAGLKNGDQLPYPVLEKLVNAIDPENKIVSELKKAAGSSTARSQLEGILTATGAQTIYETARRVELSNSADFMKAEGLALADTTSAYLDARLSGGLEATPTAFQASRQAAAARISRLMDNPDTKGNVKDILDSVNLGLDRRLEYIEKEVMASPDFFQGLSTLGDMAARSTTKAFQTDTKAALLKQLNQSGEANLIGALMGRMRARTKATQLDVNEFIDNTELMNDALLAVLGARITYSKAAAAAKGQKHYIFSSLGDFAKIMRDTGKLDTLKAALFPDTAKLGTTKFDSLSTVAIGDSVRMVMEAKELGIPVDMKQLVDRLSSRGGLQQPWSDKFRSRVPAIAKDIAEHITKPEIIAEFEKIHNTRAVANIEDVIGSAETITEDIFTALLEGRKANLDKGIDSTASRAQLVRDWFNKFAYAAGVFNQQNSHIAMNVLQAASMVFIKDGKLARLSTEMDFMPSLVGSATAHDEAARQAYAEISEDINGFFKMQNADKIVGAGRERLPMPTPTDIAKATDGLTQAKAAYEKHILDGQNITTKAGLAKWETRFAKLQKELDAARQVAWDNSIPTQHWSNGAWVDSIGYNRADALQEAQKAAEALIYTPEGIAQRTIPVVDTATLYPSYKKLSAAETKTYMDKWRKDNIERSMVANSGLHEEVATNILNDLPEFDKMGMTDGEYAQRLMQEETARVLDDATILVTVGKTSYPKGLRMLGEKLNATTGRQDLKPLLTRTESNILNDVSTIAATAHDIRDRYLKLWKPEDRQANFQVAFHYALAHEDVPGHYDTNIQYLGADLRKLIDPLFGNPETTQVVASGIDPQALARAFKKYGLSEKIGFVAPSLLNPKQLADYASWLPFAKMPEEMVGTGEAKAWEARTKSFIDSGDDPFIMLTRLAQAVQFAKSEKSIAVDFANQFGYKSRGLTYEQAVKEGWTRLQKSDGGGVDLTVNIPKPEDGGLFPPHIAEQFFSINREYNRLYNEGGMPRFVRTLMELQGLLKASMTILTPRHHITNMVGDTTTAMLAGTRNPIHWKQGLEVALRFAGEDARATWGKNKLDQKFIQLFRAYSDHGKAFETAAEGGLTVPQISVMKNGKAVRQNISYDDLLSAFQRRNIVIGNIFQNDIQGLYDSVLGDVSATGARRKMLDIVSAKLHSAAQAIEKPAGSFASYYGNIPRAAHAMQVIQSRTWNSVEEALNAASAEITRYHPTIQSLAATERRTMRLAFTFYTWLRVAHNAFIDMAANHTAAMLVPSKIQYAQASAAGLNPMSFGNPWSQEDQKNVPSYLRGSVYGPTGTNAEGQRMLYKRSLLPMDVLDTWNVNWDPTMTTPQNLLAVGGSVGKTIGRSLAIPIQLGIQAVTGYDINTGKTNQATDVPGLLDKLISNTGMKAPLQMVGYTPVGKGADSSSPLTDQQRQLSFENWLFGQKGVIVDSPANIKNAGTEEGKRAQRIYENYLKSQGK